MIICRDAFVVEGPKAGGHLGFKDEQINDEHYDLEHILPEVIGEIKEIEKRYHQEIPVIVAGGIYTGEDIRHFMDMGAAGVQMGTRFVTTKECDASDAFKQTYIDAKQDDIQIIKSPVGMPGRAIFSKFIQKVKEGQNNLKLACVSVLRPVISVRALTVLFRLCIMLFVEIWITVTLSREPMLFGRLALLR